MIRCEGLSKIYHRGKEEIRSLVEFDLKVSAGEFVVIRGPSGCGKTTLLLMLGGMLRPTAGHTIVADQDLYSLDSTQRAQFRASTIGFVFQMFHLVPYLNVLENVLMAGNAIKPEASRVRARDLLKQFGLEHRMKHTPSELSAGERQRTAIARALLNSPKLILADEPTGNLDPENATEVFRHLSAFHKSGGTVIVVTHGNGADSFSNRVVRMQAGTICQDEDGNTPTE